MEESSDSSPIEAFRRLRQGDPSGAADLIRHAERRLTRLMSPLRQIIHAADLPAPQPKTEQLFGQSVEQLRHSLEGTELRNAEHFLTQAAGSIRGELLHLAARCSDSIRIGDASGSADPDDAAGQSEDSSTVKALAVSGCIDDVARWSAFHDGIDRLPDSERAIVDLLWYHKLSRGDAAEVLNCTENAVRKQWRRARILFAEQLNGAEQQDGK